MLTLPTLTASGTPQQLGAAQGEHWREPIAGFVEARLRALRVNLRQSGRQDWDAFMALAHGCLQQLAQWDPDGFAEHQATAQAAGIASADLYAAANLTDIRDIAMFGPEALAVDRLPADNEGCTACLIPATLSKDQHLIHAQTWDLNPPDLAYVVAFHRKPSEGPASWSISLCGCPCLIGMNEHGLSYGTTNIKTTDAQTGIPYMSLLHRAQRESTAAAAMACIEAAPRAGAHTYWFADAKEAAKLECSATKVVKTPLQDEAIIHTNHCVADSIVACQATEATRSSILRFQRASAELALPHQDDTSLKKLFADRSDGIDSINRLPEDNTDTTTNACMIAHPGSKKLLACRGPADRGAWVELGF